MLDENAKQAKAKTINNILDNMYSNPNFVENFRHADLQNKLTSFKNKLEEQLPYLFNNDPQLYELLYKTIVKDSHVKNFILQNFLKIFEEGLENLGVD
ncbi:hypothetical protein [Helicobacter suis]|nr:hypothetical protein [Helicobacter suis]